MADTKRPPTRQERAACWAARDVYFKCLEEKGLWLEGLNLKTHEEIVALDPARPPVKLWGDRSLTKEEKNSLFTCHKMYELFTKDCLPSWVVHFSLLRIKDMQQNHLREFAKMREKEVSGDEFWEKATKSK